MQRKTLTEELDELRDGLFGCRVLAFADLAAALVLCQSADRPRPQEEMDALCAMASAMLDGAAAEGAAEALEGEGRIDQAIALPEGESYLFLRSAAEPGEALLCIAEPEFDIDGALEAGRALLERIGGAT
jgi:hypothetical protein